VIEKRSDLHLTDTYLAEFELPDDSRDSISVKYSENVHPETILLVEDNPDTAAETYLQG